MEDSSSWSLRSTSGSHQTPSQREDIQRHSIIERLQSASKNLREIREICRVASISVGVLHEGEILFEHGDGLRNMTPDLPADNHTVYLLASCSKMFLAAAVGILVGEGKMSWDDPIRKHIPYFNPVGDPEIGERATIRNALSHTTGLGRPQTLVWGPNGSVVTEQSSFIELFNEATTDDKDGPRFPKNKWLYNNQAYGAIGIAVENASGQRYADFLQRRIFDPLGMHDTIVTRHGVESNENIAHGYTKLKNGTFSKNVILDYTDDSNTPTLAAVGVRSSVRDMLIWAKALLESQHQDAPAENPIREINEIWKTQIALNAETHPEAEYCLGWYRGSLPSVAFGCGGRNDMWMLENLDTYKKHYLIGRDDQPRSFLGHEGACSGFTASVQIFPGTSSAVVSFANGMDVGDAADFATKLFTQALFDTKPTADVIELAKKEAPLHKKWFDDMVIQWCDDRDVTAKEADRRDYVGTYYGHGARIEVFLREETGRLAFTLNSNTKSQCDLEFYKKDDYDVYSFFPVSRDVWLTRAMRDWDYYMVGLFYFSRDDSGEVDSFCWMYEVSEELGWFDKVEDSNDGGAAQEQCDGSN